MRPSELLDRQSQERIVAAVRAAEQTTSGEIVVAVLRACDDYAAAGWVCGAGLAAIVLLGLSLFAPPMPASLYLAAQIAAVFAGHALVRVDAVRRVFVSEGVMQGRAERRAASAFAELGLRHTERKTGILLLVALFEHRVVVLADSGINEALQPGESWAEIVELVLDGIEAGRPTEGIIDAVRRCGEILSHPLPSTPDDRDEIRRELVLED